LQDLAGERWIQGVRHGATVGVLPRACRLAGFEPSIAFRTDDRSAVEGLVAAGVGVALVPQLTLPTVRPDVTVRPLDAKGLRRSVRAALPAGTYRPPAAEAMLEVLREVCDRLVDDGRGGIGPGGAGVLRAHRMGGGGGRRARRGRRAGEPGGGAAARGRTLATLGRALGPPWRKDEKDATLSGWIALAQHDRRRPP
jgi:hypothetical protein